MIWVLDSMAPMEKDGTITTKTMILILMLLAIIETTRKLGGGTRKKNLWGVHFDESDELGSWANQT